MVCVLCTYPLLLQLLCPKPDAEVYTPLKLRKASEDCKHRLPLWCGRIDVILKRDEGHLLFLKLVNNEEEILLDLERRE